MRDGHLDARPVRFAAVVLAGGQARRLGGRDKPMVAVGGVPMVGRVLAAVAEAGAELLVVVGPGREGLPGGVSVVREEPPGGGPVAAAAAGLAAVGGAEVVALLAGDLPLLSAEAIRRLRGELGEHDGAVYVDEDGRRQLLCGVWRAEALRKAIGRLEGASTASPENIAAAASVRDGAVGAPGRRERGDTGAGGAGGQAQVGGRRKGASVRALVEGLDVVEVRWERGDRPPYFDCDTEEDLRTAAESEATGNSAAAIEAGGDRPAVSEAGGDTAAVSGAGGERSAASGAGGGRAAAGGAGGDKGESKVGGR